jgi:hypothetical protein
MKINSENPQKQDAKIHKNDKRATFTRVGTESQKHNKTRKTDVKVSFRAVNTLKHWLTPEQKYIYE